MIALTANRPAGTPCKVCLLGFLLVLFSHSPRAEQAPVWQAELDTISAALLADPKQAIVRGQAFLTRHDKTAPYQVRKRVDIQVAYARALIGDVAQAYRSLEALRLEVPDDMPELQAHVRHTIGNIYYFLGDYSEASAAYFEALRLRESSGDAIAIGDTLNNIGNVLRVSNRAADSLAYFQRVQAIGREHRDALHSGDGALGAAHSHIQLQQLDEADRMLAIAKTSFADQNPHYWGAISALATTSELAILQRRQDRQLDQFELAMQRADAAGLPRLQLEILQRQIEALLAVDDPANSLPLIGQALTIARQLASDRNVTDLVLLKARALAANKRYQDAALAYQDWHKLARAYDDSRAALYTQLLQIRYQSAQKEQAIADLTKQTELQALRLRQETWRRNALLFGLVLTIMLAGTLTLYWSRRRELKRQQALTQRLLELDRVKDQVLANTSHELRTPLNGIVGLSELMLSEDLNPEHQRMLELIANSGRRLNLLVNDLLDYASLKSSNIALDIRTVPLKAAVDHAMLLCRPSLGNKLLRMINEISNDTLAVRADPDRLQQILSNLISNAIKFSDVGLIRVYVSAEGPQLRITVSDNGIGIEPAAQQRIFEPFEQADGGFSRRHEGVGLGLAICKRLVELHGGQIGVQSAQGMGSEFWFSLPRAD